MARLAALLLLFLASASPAGAQQIYCHNGGSPSANCKAGSGSGNVTTTGFIIGQVPVATGISALNATIPYGTAGDSVLLETSPSGLISSAVLPLPAAMALGAVYSFNQVTHEWINSLGTNGQFNASQPGFSDLNGSATVAQLPTSGTWPFAGTISGNLTFSGQPTFSGTLSGTQTSCLGLSSGGALVAASGACGSGSGSVTWPSAGDLVVSTGNNTPNGLAESDNAIVYGTGGAFATLAGCASGVLIYSGSDVPSCSTTLPSGLTIPGATASGTWNFTGTFEVGGYAMTFPSAAKTLAANDWSNMAAPTNGDLMVSAGGNAEPTAFGGSDCFGGNFAESISGAGALTCAAPPGTQSLDVVLKTTNYSVQTSDTTNWLGANGSSAITFTLPNPGTAVGNVYQFFDAESAQYGYVLTTTSGSADFYGQGFTSGTSVTLGANAVIACDDNTTSYQCTTYGNVGAAYLALANTFTAGQAVMPASVSSCTGTVTISAATANDFTCSMSGNVTMANPSNLLAGETINLTFTQPASGGPYTVSWGSEWQAPGGSSTLVLGSTASEVDVISCRSISTSIIRCAPVMLAFSH